MICSLWCLMLIGKTCVDKIQDSMCKTINSTQNDNKNHVYINSKAIYEIVKNDLKPLCKENKKIKSPQRNTVFKYKKNQSIQTQIWIQKPSKKSNPKYFDLYRKSAYTNDLISYFIHTNKHLESVYEYLNDYSSTYDSYRTLTSSMSTNSCVTKDSFSHALLPERYRTCPEPSYILNNDFDSSSYLLSPNSVYCRKESSISSMNLNDNKSKLCYTWYTNSYFMRSSSPSTNMVNGIQTRNDNTSTNNFTPLVSMRNPQQDSSKAVQRCKCTEQSLGDGDFNSKGIKNQQTTKRRIKKSRTCTEFYI